MHACMYVWGIFVLFIYVLFFCVYQIYGHNVWCVCISSMHIVVIQDGWTALKAAARNGHREVVELLIQHGADVNAKDKVRNV